MASSLMRLAPRLATAGLRRRTMLPSTIIRGVKTMTFGDTQEDVIERRYAAGVWEAVTCRPLSRYLAFHQALL